MCRGRIGACGVGNSLGGDVRLRSLTTSSGMRLRAANLCHWPFVHRRGGARWPYAWELQVCVLVDDPASVGRFQCMLALNVRVSGFAPCKVGLVQDVEGRAAVQDPRP
eukprot:3834612-Pyramimonas_sp.AAC.1